MFGKLYIIYTFFKEIDTYIQPGHIDLTFSILPTYERFMF